MGGQAPSHVGRGERVVLWVLQLLLVVVPAGRCRCEVAELCGGASSGARWQDNLAAHWHQVGQQAARQRGEHRQQARAGSSQHRQRLQAGGVQNCEGGGQPTR